MATMVAPRMTQAALRKENGLVTRVELRGLEPLTPTLPGHHDRVRGGSPLFRKPLDLPVSHNGERRRTRANATNCNQNCNQRGVSRSAVPLCPLAPTEESNVVA